MNPKTKQFLIELEERLGEGHDWCGMSARAYRKLCVEYADAAECNLRTANVWIRETAAGWDEYSSKSPTVEGYVRQVLDQFKILTEETRGE